MKRKIRRRGSLSNLSGYSALLAGLAIAVIAYLVFAALGALVCYFSGNPLALTGAMSLTALLIGGAVGFGLFFLVSWLFEKLYKREGLGGGDVKLAAVAGLLLGWERLLLALIIATIPAAIIMSILKRGKEGEEKEFPFAPFLIIGFSTSIFFGTQILNWYLSLIGLR